MPDIYHFCEDEKFINSAYRQFETLYTGENRFLVYGVTDGQTRHITLTEHFSFITDFETAFKEIPDKSIVIFHSLPSSVIPHLHHLPKAVKTIWFIFGFEVYLDPLFYSEDQSLDTLTRKEFGQPNPNSLKKRIKEIAWPYFRKIKPDLYLTFKERKREKLKRIDYFGSSFPEEYKQICKILQLTRPSFDFWYYPIENILDIHASVNNEKEYILIGNSGFKTINHLDIFEKLRQLKVEKQNIKVPFSYGNPDYMAKIKSLTDLPHNTIDFIEDFYPLQEYNLLLSKVKTAIFNTRRQQAVGNIIALLYMGAKVFISEKNTFYHYLKRNKIIVFSYEKDLNEKSVVQGLPSSEIEKNRQLLYELLNEKKLESELKHSIENIKHNG